MTAKRDDLKVFPGDESTKFMLLQRTIENGGDPDFSEDPPYILNQDGNHALGVDVTLWHSITVFHTCQDFTLVTYPSTEVTVTPWRYYTPVTPQALAAGGVTLPPRGVWIADDAVTMAIDPETLGTSQQKVFSTLNADRMFFQVKDISADVEEEAGQAGASWIRQAIFGVTPRNENGTSPSVVGAAGGGGGGGTTTIPDPVNTNTIELAGNPIDLGSGNVGAGTQLVTLADDDPAVTSLQVIDDWNAVHDSPAGTDGVRLEGYASDAQVAAVSANGDDVRKVMSRHGEDYLASHTYVTQSDRSEEIDPANQWYEFSTLVAVTNGTDATYSYYIPMAGYTRLDMQLILSGGSGTVTVTVEGSIQADGTAPASLTYQDVTNQAYGSASFTSSIALVDNSEFFCAFNYVKVKIVAASTANDGDWTIFIKKTWR